MTKNGKKSKYILSNIFLQNIDESIFTIDSYAYGQYDPVRFFSRNFWTLKNNSLQVAKHEENYMFDIENLSDNTIVLKANKKKFTSTKINQDGSVEENFDSKKWEEYVISMSNYLNRTFEDFSIDFSEPIEFNEEMPDKNISFINKKSVYNFYSSIYESVFNNKITNEVVIPSISSLVKSMNDKNKYNKNLFFNLGGVISDSLSQAVFTSTSVNERLVNYYNTFAEEYDKNIYSLVANSISEQTSESDYSKETNAYAKSLNFLPFPFYLDLQFSNISYGEITNQINKTGRVYEDMIRYFKTNNFQEMKSFVNFSNTFKNIDIKTFDLKTLIIDDIQGLRSTGTADNVRVLVAGDRMYKDIQYANLLEYLKNNVINKNRKYAEFMHKSCNHDVLVYKIEKYLNENQTPIQTFWLDSNEVDFFRFIDSQVKYNQQYTYKIVAYTIVMGNVYEYQPYDYSTKAMERLNDIHNGHFKLNIKNTAKFKIFQIPYAIFTNTIQEPPYTKPVLKTSQKEDQVYFEILDSRTSSHDEIEIVDTDDFMLFQNLQNEIGLIKTVKPDENMSELEIYKMTSFPSSYISFQGKKYKTIILENNKSFSDSVLPNIKYYYLFRYLNKHKIPSGVSKVFEIEMKDEDGYMYLNTKEIDLKKTIELSDKKDFKRYLLIRPSSLQTYINNSEDFKYIEDVTLGPKKEPVWEKDFIIRIKSKKTNRILEFNLKSKFIRKNK